MAIHSEYISPDDPSFPSNFVAQFDWTGSRDLIPYLSIQPALDFRIAIGGEKKIMDYCHFLALTGGRVMAEVLGTEMLDQSNSGELTASMVDVRLPLLILPNETRSELRALVIKFQDKMLENECFVAVYVHDGKWWTRASAQIWLEMSDFEHVARVLLKLCEGFRAARELVA